MNAKVIGCKRLPGGLVCLLFWLAASAGLADTPNKFALSATPNRLVPKHSAPSAEFSLPEEPSEQELMRTRLFPEPLLAVGATPSTAQNRQLAMALRLHAQRAVADDFSTLEEFITQHPDSPWAPSLRFNLGLEYSHTGWFSKTVEAWENAWASLKTVTDPTLKPLADRAAGELTSMYVRLGRKDDLSALLDSIEGRPIFGSAAQNITAGRQGLWFMQNEWGHAYRCGSLALDAVRGYNNRALLGDRDYSRLKVRREVLRG
jgi:hypothetical protein